MVLLGLAARLAAWNGITGYDDWVYAHLAANVADGHLAPAAFGEYRLFRWSVVLPVAAVFRAFGVRSWSALLWPLLASTAAVALVDEIARRLFGRVAGRLAGWLQALLPLPVLWATRLYPDEIYPCLLGGALLLCLEGAARGRRSGTALQAAGGVCVFLATLARETSIVAVAPLLLLGLVALRRFWWGLAAGAAVGLGAEAAVYRVLLGDPLAHWRTAAAALRAYHAYDTTGHGSALTLYPEAMLGGTGHGLASFGIFYYLFLASLLLSALWGRRGPRGASPCGSSGGTVPSASRAPAGVVMWWVLLFGYLQLGGLGPFQGVAIHKQIVYLNLLTLPAVLVTAHGGALAWEHGWHRAVALLLLLHGAVGPVLARERGRRNAWFQVERRHVIDFISKAAAPPTVWTAERADQLLLDWELRDPLRKPYGAPDAPIRTLRGNESHADLSGGWIVWSPGAIPPESPAARTVRSCGRVLVPGHPVSIYAVAPVSECAVR